MIVSWRITVTINAMIIGLFENIPIVKVDCCVERIAMTWPSWLKQSTVKVIVCQLSYSWRMAHACNPMVTKPIRRPMTRMCHPMPSANTLLSGALGGRFIMFASEGSDANASPGSPSDIRFTHRICVANKGIGKPRKWRKREPKSLRNCQS